MALKVACALFLLIIKIRSLEICDDWVSEEFYTILNNIKKNNKKLRRHRFHSHNEKKNSSKNRKLLHFDEFTLRGRRPFIANATTSYVIKNYSFTGSGGLKIEDKLLLSKVYEKVDRIFEYGVGESTLIAAHVGVPNLVGVDSDDDWIQHVKSILGHSLNKDYLNYKFIHSFIGGKGIELGYPPGWPDTHSKEFQQNIPLFPNYSKAVQNKKPAFDFYFIDGRFRLSCLIQAMLHASSRGKQSHEFLLALHDFIPDRPYYNDIFYFADRIAGINPNSKFCFNYPLHDDDDNTDDISFPPSPEQQDNQNNSSYDDLNYHHSPTTVPTILPSPPCHSSACPVIIFLRRKANVSDAELRHIWWEKFKLDPRRRMIL
uniref:Uncharacterized protein n=1 Tax=Aureoumbra lagunensis TaxID=44058 RepID=A0A7S3NJY1_9STRA|mmetsp:Transcript_21192/g.27438  ORF Transcript_21192/g.27438 Transcript_21192/m.27438 type:complete len:373 (-) Transcript_21192:180-1298(-)